MRRTAVLFSLIVSACHLSPDSKLAVHDQLGALTVANPSMCTPPPAAPAMNAGLCVCDAFDAVGTVKLRQGSDGTLARLGVNGLGNVVGDVRIEGDAVIYEGLTGTGTLRLDGSLSSAGDIDSVGALVVGKDLIAAGALDGVGDVQVGGSQQVPGPAPALPCDCGANALDIVGLVADAKAHNDNAALGIPTLDVVGKYDLALPGGRYYFAGVTGVGDTVIHVAGAVALFIDGDLEEVGTNSFKLEPGATLDLYVSGNVDLVGDSNLGPGQLRLFVGGQREINAVGNQRWVGSLYAPQATLTLVGDAHIQGALLVESLGGVGNLDLQSAAQQEPSPSTCAATPAAHDCDTADAGISEITPL